MDKLRLNNSFFNSSVSMSMSQMSDQWSQQNSTIINNPNNQTDLLKLALSYIQALVTNDLFYKRLKVYYDKQTNKHKNHHYLQNLLQTLQYILSKQKLLPTKQHFIKQRNIYFKTFLHSSTPVTFIPSNQQLLQKVNDVIFTDQLDKILTLISSKQCHNNNSCCQQLLLALNRVYFVARKASTRKHFRNIKYTAQDIFYNLSKLYIHSFSSKLSTLQQSRHPIFLLLKSYLLTFHLPVFKQFTNLIQQLSKCYNSNIMLFYQQSQQIIQKLMSKFIQQLPLQLIQFLHMLYKLIQTKSTSNSNLLISPILTKASTSQQSIRSQSQSPQSNNMNTNSNNVSSLVVVKRFFIYSFLCQPQLIKQFIFSSNSSNSNTTTAYGGNNKSSTSPSPSTLQHYEQVCNYIINIFFSSSIKKYTTNYTIHQLSPLVQLSQLIQRKLQDRIITYSQQCNDFYYYDQQTIPSSSLDNYFIQQPILNYDYQILLSYINAIQFTPKDNKHYQIVPYSIINNNNNMNLINNNNNPNINKSKQYLINNNHNNINYFTQNSQQLLYQQINNNKQDMFLKNNNQYNHHYNRTNNKRQLTLSPNKFTFYEQKQSLNNTQTFSIKPIINSNTTQGFYNNININNYESEQNNQIDLLTWMTIGGSHNYNQKVSARKIKLSKTISMENKHYNISMENKHNVNRGNRIDSNQIYKQKSSYKKTHSNNSNRNNKPNTQISQHYQHQQSNNSLENKQKHNRRREFNLLNKQKVKQINRLYQQYASRNVYYI